MSKDPVPQGMYKPAVRFGDIIITAGMTPRRDGVMNQKVPARSFRHRPPRAAKMLIRTSRTMTDNGRSLLHIRIGYAIINLDRKTEELDSFYEIGGMVRL